MESCTNSLTLTPRLVGRRSAAERQALNTVAQGSAADLCKLAMAAVHRAAASQLPPDSCRLLLQVSAVL